MSNLPEGAKFIGTEVDAYGNTTKHYQLPSEVHFVSINGVLVFDEGESEDDIT